MEDERVVARERHRLYDEDLLKFGNVVTRGPGTCFASDEPTPLSCRQPIRWKSSRNKLELETTSNFVALLESFPPLHDVVRYSWVADRYLHPMIDVGHILTPSYSFGEPPAAPETSQMKISPNTFQVPDYDDEDDEDDEDDADISFVQETVLKPKLEIVGLRTLNFPRRRWCAR